MRSHLPILSAVLALLTVAPAVAAAGTANPPATAVATAAAGPSADPTPIPLRYELGRLPVLDEKSTPWCASYTYRLLQIAEHDLTGAPPAPGIAGYHDSNPGVYGGETITALPDMPGVWNIQWPGGAPTTTVTGYVITQVWLWRTQIEAAVWHAGVAPLTMSAEGWQLAQPWMWHARHLVTIRPTGHDTAASLPWDHEALVVGYTADGLIVQTSWGRAFGDDGRFVLSWRYLMREGGFNLALPDQPDGSPIDLHPGSVPAVLPTPNGYTW